MIIISDIKNEYGNTMALVILCSRVYFKTNTIEDLNSFITNNNIDWVELFTICRKHCIRPLVFRMLLKAKLPEKIKQKINLKLGRISVSIIKQAKETERIIRIFDKNGIKLIPYKGTAFSKQFFGDISWRESSDIDLIININDLSKTFKIMEEEHYNSYQMEYYSSIGHKNFINTHKDLNFDKFIGKKREFHIEFHFNIIGKNIFVPKMMNEFNIQQTEKDSLVSETITILKPFEHFKAISMHHMLQDGIGYLKTIIDLTQVLNEIIKNDLTSNNPFFKDDIIIKLKSTYNIALIEAVINDLIGINFSNNKVEDKQKLFFVTRILSSKYRKRRENKFPIWDATKHHYNYFVNTVVFYKRKKDKLKFFGMNIWSIISPQPDDHSTTRLNKRLYFLYYIIRPFRLLLSPIDPKK